jgi:RHS repeat-associated protein
LADSSGTVALVQGYTPFGVPLWSEGSGATGYGFTGERWEAYTDLLFLRARYYQPGTGRFVSKDPWGGSMMRPATLNGFNYVNNNPVRLVDLLGLCDYDPYDPYFDYDCWVLALEAAKLTGMPVEVVGEQSHENLVLLLASNPLPNVKNILNISQGEGLCTLIRYFEAFPGPANEALRSLLRDTAGFGGINVPVQIQAQFGVEIPGGECLCAEFVDQRHYDEYWGGTTSYQISHFLTAVAMAYHSCDSTDMPLFSMARVYRRVLSFPELPSSFPYGSEETALRMIVGHELESDMQPWAWWVQYQAAKGSHLDLFLQAMQADLAGDAIVRDELLARIIELDTADREQMAERPGNSSEDLLLSLKGWELGCSIKNQSMVSAQEVATWFRDNLVGQCMCR